VAANSIAVPASHNDLLTFEDKNSESAEDLSIAKLLTGSH
jgi:hypothetical protein